MITVISLNFQRSDLAIRSSFQFNHEELNYIYADLKNKDGLRGVVILTTCNRTEVYMHHDSRISACDMLKQLQAFKHTNIPLARFDITCKPHQAVEYMIEVANGLNSMVLGDKQILSQLKTAFRLSQQHGFVSGEIERIFQAMFRSHKRISNQTTFHKGSRSVSHLAINIIIKKYSNRDMPVLVIGAGEIATDLLKYLSAAKFTNVVLVNRTYNKAAILARQYNYAAVEFSNDAEFINRFQVIISCAAAHQILTIPAQVTDQLFIDLTTHHSFIQPAGFDRNSLVTLDYFNNLKGLPDKNQLQDMDRVKSIIREEAHIFFSWIKKRSEFNHQRAITKAA
ncbi:MAG: Glutamyl-tRNA reductase [Mucilaginibacter sp.]|nr:Glutamyl-tRNA reductase [Mucilaginibacter sp.]